MVKAMCKVTVKQAEALVRAVDGITVIIRLPSKTKLEADGRYLDLEAFDDTENVGSFIRTIQDFFNFDAEVTVIDHKGEVANTRKHLKNVRAPQA